MGDGGLGIWTQGEREGANVGSMFTGIQRTVGQRMWSADITNNWDSFLGLKNYHLNGYFNSVLYIYIYICVCVC